MPIKLNSTLSPEPNYDEAKIAPAGATLRGRFGSPGARFRGFWVFWGLKVYRGLRGSGFQGLGVSIYGLFRGFGFFEIWDLGFRSFDIFDIHTRTSQGRPAAILVSILGFRA